jgi:copper chaperone CopZ
MTKTIKIDGMSCAHCSARVEKSLNAIAGVSAKVDLKAKTATVTAETEISDAELEAAVEDAGYAVVK